MATSHLTQPSPADLARALDVKVRKLTSLANMLSRVDVEDTREDGDIIDAAVVRDAFLMLADGLSDASDCLAELRHALEASQEGAGASISPDPVP
jgi:hypothetical protein